MRSGFDNFIIESPTRGTLRELEYDDGDWTPRWSTTSSRNDRERTMQFNSLLGARREFDKIPLDARRKSKAAILWYDPDKIEYVRVWPNDGV